MAAVPGAQCAEISRTLNEPMVGTAPSTRRWLCLEWPQAWPADINHTREPAVRTLLARAVTAGFRPLMIRSTERQPERRPPRIFLTDTAPGHSVTTVLPIERLERLDDLPLPEPDHPLPGDPVTRPLFLVCAHEQRDPCCGLAGSTLLDAVGGPDVFAASHLGGHRFAPTALILPTGYVYGRLDPASATAIRLGAADRVVTTDRCRGRCTWSPRGQVAELAVREATGLRSPDALIVEDDDSSDTVEVHTATWDRWAVDVEFVDVDATRPASCGARPTLIVPLRATAVRELQPGR
jgi:hypothetical protein